MDQLAAYESCTNPLHYTMKFIDGLHDDLKAFVLIQRPLDLDTAYVLAQLQEELALPSKKREFKKQDFSSPYKYDSLCSSVSKEKPPMESSGENRNANSAKPRSMDDRWSAFRAMC